MTDLIERLRRLYVQHGTNYVQESADEIERLIAERDALLNALETMLIGACAVGVPHAGERQVLQEAVDSARAVINAARKEQA